MSYVSGIYRFAVAIKGGSSYRRSGGYHHNQPNKKLPDEAVLSMRREYEAAPRGKKLAVIREYAERYGASVNSLIGIAYYRSRSNPDRPLDPSFVRT